MRLIFFGTGILGLPTLRRLAASVEHELLAVFTQPDRQAGRGMKLRASPIKELALELDLPIHQPPRINADLESVRSYQPDVIVVAAYGQILSKELIDVPRVGIINIHASLLPKYRGAAPIQWSLINGEAETGITTFFIEEGLDTGDILLKRSIPISDEDTTASLEIKLADLGAEVMLETLSGLELGTLKADPQNHQAATLAPKIKKEMALIDWSKNAREIFNLIRGLNPNPGAYTFFNGKRLKIHRSALKSIAGTKGTAGEIVELDDLGPVVGTGAGQLILTEVQLEGKKSMSGSDFVRGYQIRHGSKLGS